MENIQYDLLKTELGLTQAQMDKYDEISIRIKTWAVTLWIASVGWFLQSENSSIFKWIIFALILFWIIDAINKVYREDYKKRRGEVVKMLSDLAQKQKVEGVVMNLPQHSMNTVFFQIFSPHLGLVYWILIALSFVAK